MSDEDRIPDPLAALDQAMAAMVTLAKAVRGYYVALLTNGFTEDQAIMLTAMWQTAILEASR